MFAYKTTRSALGALHLYLGLLFGAVFALIGLTGSFLVFYPEIDQFLNTQLIVNDTDGNETKPISYQQVFEQLHTRFPERHGIWRVESPRKSDQVIFARYLKPEEKDPAVFSPLVVALDPSSLNVLNARFWGEYLVTWVYDLHYSLLIGETGKYIISCIGFFLIFTLGVGYYIWLPRGNRKLYKLTPKIRPNFFKAVYDLHSYLGAYGGVLLIVATLTGIALAIPQWINPAINWAFRSWEQPIIKSTIPLEGTSRIGADQAINRALAKFPTAQLRWIEAPVDVSGAYFVRLKQESEPSDRFPKTYVWVDQFNGDILAIKDPFQVPAGEVILDWLHPLHNGEAFGLTGRWLAFGTGLTPLFLLCSGLIRWRQKLKAKNMQR